MANRKKYTIKNVTSKKRYKKRKKVSEMPAVAEKVRTSSEDRELVLARARELSAKITKATRTAGITHEELEERAYRAYLDVRGDNRSNRS